MTGELHSLNSSQRPGIRPGFSQPGTVDGRSLCILLSHVSLIAQPSIIRPRWKVPFSPSLPRAPGEVGDDGDQLARANRLRHMYLEA